MYLRYMKLDAHPAKRDEMLAALSQLLVLGIEVTEPDLAQACVLGNIDPQHLGKRSDISAVEAVSALFNGGCIATTIRPDLDAVGSMALLGLVLDAVHKAKIFSDDVLKRIEQIGEADRFAHGPWPGVRPLPSIEQPWPTAGTASETEALAAIAGAVEDEALPLSNRVELLRQWLLTGEEPAHYRENAEAHRELLVAALERGDITITQPLQELAVVVSELPGSLGLGYCLAPVVIAHNPAQRKFTIAQYTEGYVRMADVYLALNHTEMMSRSAELDNRWGGSPTIGGSPQGEGSVLNLEQVVGVVACYIGKLT